MSSPSSLFMRVGLSKKMYEKWLKSPITYVENYDDWPAMNPLMASNYDDWAGTFPKPDFMSVEEFLDLIANHSRYFCCEYDDDQGAFFAADAQHNSSMIEIAAGIAALRNIAAFKDDDEPSFLYVFPALSGGDPEALLEIKRGSSSFRPTNDDSPDVLYFVSEAEEFIEVLLEDEE